jgi:Protein of unknown function (DUF2934)
MMLSMMEFDQLLLNVAAVQKPQAPMGGASRTIQTKRSAREEIELRAYQIYVSRGAVHGLDLEDWLQAEREVTIGPSAACDTPKTGELP